MLMAFQSASAGRSLQMEGFTADPDTLADIESGLCALDRLLSDSSPDTEVSGLQDADIPGNEVSSREVHNIARHNILDVN